MREDYVGQKEQTEQWVEEQQYSLDLGTFRHMISWIHQECTEREYIIFMLYVGLSEERRKYTYQEIGDAFGITRERARQLMYGIRRKLKAGYDPAWRMVNTWDTVRAVGAGSGRTPWRGEFIWGIEEMMGRIPRMQHDLWETTED